MNARDGGAVAAGTWVEVEAEILAPGERTVAAADTAATALVGRVRGFTVAAARLGQACDVVTLAGRRVSGRLRDAEPRHAHGFGRTDPLLVGLGGALREVRP